MNRLQIYLDELQLPIKSLFIAVIFIAIGTFIRNPYVNELINLGYPMLSVISNIALFSGGLIISLFPYIVFLKLLNIRTEEKNITLVGIISYLSFLIILLFLGSQTLPQNAYISYLTIRISGLDYRLVKTGIFGLLGVYIIVRRVYAKPMIIRNADFTKLMDRDSIRLLKSLVYTVIFAILFTYASPYIIDAIYVIAKFVSLDFNNPMSLFLYNVFERILIHLNLDSILRQEMWFGALGGTWNSLQNIFFVGDVNIWAAQLQDSVAILGVGSAGRFTTVYYILNLFAIPGYIFAMAMTVSDKKKFRKGMVSALLGTLLSLISGIVFPIEILMLLTAPILLIFHLFVIGFVSALLLGMGITVGFSYHGVLNAANPGIIYDVLSLLRYNIIGKQVVTLLLLGVLIFVMYFYVTRFYYSKMAIDILNIGSIDDEINDFVERVGGLKNIKKISSTPSTIHVSLEDEDNINVSGLHRQGVTRIVQTKDAFILSFGAGSYMMQKGVNALLVKAEEEINDQ